jgi:hypothetical protein
MELNNLRKLLFMVSLTHLVDLEAMKLSNLGLYFFFIVLITFGAYKYLFYFVQLFLFPSLYVSSPIDLDFRFIIFVNDVLYIYTDELGNKE